MLLNTHRIKIAARHLTAIAAVVLLALGSSHAAVTEDLPEPPPASMSRWHRSDASEDAASAMQDDSAQLGLAGDKAYLNHDVSDIGPPAFPFSSSSFWRDGCWYGDFDFVTWSRTRPMGKVLGRDLTRTGVAFHNVLNKNRIAIPIEPGGRVTLGYFLDRDIDNRDHSIEVTYLGFNNWSGDESLRSLTGQTLVVPEARAYGGFNQADTYMTNYQSDLQSLEIDYRIRNRPARDRMIMGSDGFWSQQLNPGCTQSLFFGLRGISEPETFHWLSLRNNVSPDTFSGDFFVQTKNVLLGTQFGGDFMNVHDKWYWGIKGDIGVYCNFSEGNEHILVVDAQAPEPPVRTRATNQTAASFGELTFMLGYNVNDHLLLHAGWDLALLGGVALAPDQVSFNTYLANATPMLNTGGVIFYTGLSLGLEAYW